MLRGVVTVLMVGSALTVLPSAPAQAALDVVEQRLSGEGGRNGLIAGLATTDEGARLATLDPDTGVVDLVPLGDYKAVGDLDWTPDGTRITVLDWDPDDGDERILDVDPLTGDATLVWDVPSGIDAQELSWNPDGTQLALTYRELPDDDPDTVEGAGIAILTPASGSFVPVIAGDYGSPDWSPAGDRIAFIGYRSSQVTWHETYLAVADVDGTDLQIHTPVGYSAATPDWAPDGQRIAVAQVEHLRTGDFWEMHVVDADTGANRKVSILKGQYTSTIWSPDGESVLYRYGEGGFSTRDPEIGVRYLGTRGSETIWSGRDFWAYAWGTDPGCLLEDGTAARAEDGTLEVGPWVAQGCFTQARGVHRTRDEMRLSGVTLTPVRGQIRIDKDAGRLTSTGPVDVTVEGRAGGVRVGPIRLEQGKVLDWNLAHDTLPKFEVEDVLELPVGKPLQVRAVTGGRSKLGLPLRIPFLGLPELPELTLTNELGLVPSQLDFSLPPTQVTDFVRLTDVKVSYDIEARVWESSAVLAGAGTAVHLGFRAVKGQIREAHLRIPSLDLAGLVRVTDFDLTYDRALSDAKKNVETYRLSANSPVDADLAHALRGSVVYVDGALDRFEVKAEVGRFWGVVRVKQLNLSWSAEDGWSGGAHAALRPGDVTGAGLNVGFELRSVKHRLVAASLTAPVLRMGVHEQGFELRDVEVTWSLEDGPGNVPQDVWSAAATLQWPGGPAAPSATANVRFVDGAFVSGSVKGTSVTLSPGLVLPQVGATLSLSPLSITGTATVQLGPEIPFLGAATGSLQLAYRAAAQAGTPDTYDFTGELTLGTGALAEARVTYLTDGRITAEGVYTWQLASWAVSQGRLAGTVDGRSYRLQGSAVIGINGKEVNGTARVTQQGVAGCVGLAGTRVSVGFGYRWDGTLRQLAGACDLEKFTRPARGTLAVRAGEATIQVGAGEDVLALEVSGDGGAPTGTLAGPDGTVIDLGATEGVDGDRFLLRDATTGTTYVAIGAPAPGSWTIEPGDGPAVDDVRAALALPEPEVAASIVADGDRWVLEHDVTEVEGQRVVVSEMVDGVEHVLATVTGTGSTQVEPAPGGAGSRALVATVLQDGLVRTTIDLGTYAAPAIVACTLDGRCETTTTARTDRQGRRLLAHGTVAPATSGAVLLRLDRGRHVLTRVVDLSGGTWSTTFRRRAEPRRCVLTASYLGSDTHLSSSDRTRTRC